MKFINLSQSPTNKISKSDIISLANSYNTLYDKQTLTKMLRGIVSEAELKNYTKPQIHNILNDIILKQYIGELTIKALLVKKFYEEDVTAAFEIKTRSSRVDFLRINGYTISYEIKSGLDNLQKLKKQAFEYESLFEYNYIVTDPKHIEKAQEIVPKHYGIITVNKNILKEIRKAGKSTKISPSLQLALFNQAELKILFNGLTHRENILKKHNKNGINEKFKEMLKKRYSRKWTFLKNNLLNILPIDYQYFFHHNINPHIIYSI